MIEIIQIIYKIARQQLESQLQAGAEKETKC